MPGDGDSGSFVGQTWWPKTKHKIYPHISGSTHKELHNFVKRHQSVVTCAVNTEDVIAKKCCTLTL